MRTHSRSIGLLGQVLLLTCLLTAADAAKPRVIATTDGEWDDQCSMVRFLLYCNDWDLVAIVHTNSQWQREGHGRSWIDKTIDAYDQVRPNLLLHDSAYPTAAFLKSRVYAGIEDPSVIDGLPPFKDTPGTDLIVSALRDPDTSKLHIAIWGGCATVAHALWRLKTSYPADVARAVAKARITSISLQDASAWRMLESNLHKEFTIAINGTFLDTWSYSHDKNPSASYLDKAWVAANIIGHGALGALYPADFIAEGDSPSFLAYINNGLRTTQDFGWGGWGARYSRLYDWQKNPRNVWSDGNDARDSGMEKYSLTRWTPATQNNLAARFDWCVKSFAQANHPPEPVVEGGVDRLAKPGATVTLSAEGTSDPDQGQQLSYRWWQYVEAGTVSKKVTIANASSKSGASFSVPDELGKTMHVILEVTDNGTPPLTGYQRVVLTVSNAVPSAVTSRSRPASSALGARPAGGPASPRFSLVGRRMVRVDAAQGLVLDGRVGRPGVGLR